MAWTKRVFTGTLAAVVRRSIGLSAALGYPKFEGNPRDARSPAARRVRFFVRPKDIGGGNGLVIIPINHPGVAALDGTVINIPATYDGVAVPGGAGTFTLDLSAGVVFNPAAHDFDEADPV